MWYLEPGFQRNLLAPADLPLVRGLTEVASSAAPIMTFYKSRVSDGLCTSRDWGEDHPRGGSPQKLVHNHRKI